MSDRELLEMAAKAAGMNDWKWREESQAMAHFNVSMGCYYTDHCGDIITWNPLTDDGDALRLAVKLELDVMTRRAHANSEDDPYAATRRSITHVAAEIGRSMP